MAAMFTDSHDRRDWVIGLVLTAIVFAGVHWLRSRPPHHPTLALQAAEASRDIAVFKLTGPLPQARDGIRDVMMSLNECRDVRGRKVFSERPCGSQSPAGQVAE